MKKFGFIFLIFGTPLMAFAAANTFAEVLKILQDLLNGLLPVLIALAVALFLWGVLKYIRTSDNPDERTEGRELMVYGIVAIFVMISFWGLVNILVGTFFGSPSELIIQGGTTGDVPQFR